MDNRKYLAVFICEYVYVYLDRDAPLCVLADTRLENSCGKVAMWGLGLRIEICIESGVCVYM